MTMEAAIGLMQVGLLVTIAYRMGSFTEMLKQLSQRVLQLERKHHVTQKTP